jgi:hypothetical protein
VADEGSAGGAASERSAGRAEGEPSGAAAVPGFRPENELEQRLIRDPELLRGLAWGSPRRGHPEGTVAAHVADLIETIDRWEETGARRADLRFIALVHDALKFRVREWLPKTGENHHAVRARRLARRYTEDERLLATIELHDRPYALWRRGRRRGEPDAAGLERMLVRVPDVDLFLRFVQLDGSTEGKDPAPIEWLEDELRGRGLR